MTRAFIAITPSAQIRQKISVLIRELHKKFPQVSWERPEKVHLTLAFLGALTDQEVGELASALKEVTSAITSFELSLTHLSYFYKKHGDSIVFINIRNQGGALRTFYIGLKKELNNLGFFLPERLAAHMTIGRLKRMRHPHDVKRILAEINKVEIGPMGDFQVSSIDLYESQYSKDVNTTQYRLLKSFPLK